MTPKILGKFTSFMVEKYTSVNFFKIFEADLGLENIKAKKYFFEVGKKLWPNGSILTSDSESATPKTEIYGWSGDIFHKSN